MQRRIDDLIVTNTTKLGNDTLVADIKNISFVQGAVNMSATTGIHLDKISIHNVPRPVKPLDVANKQYVDEGGGGGGVNVGFGLKRTGNIIELDTSASPMTWTSAGTSFNGGDLEVKTQKPPVMAMDEMHIGAAPTRRNVHRQAFTTTTNTAVPQLLASITCDKGKSVYIHVHVMTRREPLPSPPVMRGMTLTWLLAHDAVTGKMVSATSAPDVLDEKLGQWAPATRATLVLNGSNVDVMVTGAIGVSLMWKTTIVIETL